MAEHVRAHDAEAFEQLSLPQAGDLHPQKRGEVGTFACTEVQIDLEVWDLRQLNQLIGQLKELPCVSTIMRVFA